MESLALLVIVTLCTFVWFLKVKRGKNNRPPGPFQWPLFGNLYQVSRGDPIPFVSMHKLAKVHGPLMSLKLGVRNYVILSSSKVIQDIFAGKADYIDIESPKWIEFKTRGRNLGIIFGHGSPVMKLRRFLIRSLRDLNFKKMANIEYFLDIQLQYLKKKLIEETKQGNGKVRFHANYFAVGFLSFLLNFVSGNDNDNSRLQDPRYDHLITLKDKATSASTFASGALTAFPFLLPIMKRTKAYRQLVEAEEAERAFVKEECTLHLSKMKNGENANCLLDIFSENILNAANNDKSIFNEDQFHTMTQDLLTAGADTETNAMSGIILILITHPQVQQKVYKEIRDVLKGRNVSLEDKEKMPYTQATILECLRWYPIVVHFRPRVILHDFEYEGYTFTKDVLLLVNQYSVNRDENIWKDPYTINPNRFLNSMGQIDKTAANNLVAFGSGKRNCIGESLARDSLFYYVVSIVQTFDLSLVPGEPIPSLQPKPGFIAKPVEFTAQLHLRTDAK